MLCNNNPSFRFLQDESARSPSSLAGATPSSLPSNLFTALALPAHVGRSTMPVLPHVFFFLVAGLLLLQFWGSTRSTRSACNHLARPSSVLAHHRFTSSYPSRHLHCLLVAEATTMGVLPGANNNLSPSPPPPPQSPIRFFPGTLDPWGIQYAPKVAVFPAAANLGGGRGAEV
ncbi:hypothetical protein EDC01DRAFT_263340 [Geopyxis carbonaria]|nr:hypothetical protein EDC01DRAFT_263340 [Geopyxis carbonaria]